MVDRDSNSDVESESAEIDWKSLEGQLSEGAWDALRQHMLVLTDDDGPSRGGNDESTTKLLSNTNDNNHGALLPDSNKAYKLKEYWEERFGSEEHYDWLTDYDDIAEHIREIIPKDARILIVGCGNSGLSADMYDDGYRNVMSTDFSETVVEKMRAKNESSRPGLRWAQMDMLALDMEDGSVDAVVDKAAMDALMVDKGDPWNPNGAVVEQIHRMCSEISRVLTPGGVYIQLSFEPAHFRRKLLMGEHHTVKHTPMSGATSDSGIEVIRDGQSLTIVSDGADANCRGDKDSSAKQEASATERSRERLYGWDVDVSEVQREGGCLGHFLYVMRKNDGVL